MVDDGATGFLVEANDRARLRRAGGDAPARPRPARALRRRRRRARRAPLPLGRHRAPGSQGVSRTCARWSGPSPRHPRFRCPDCGKAVGAARGRARPAPGAGAPSRADEGVWNLLPRDLDAAERAEDRLHDGRRRADVAAALLPQALLGRVVRRALAARPSSTRGTRRFLEIGGGLCYASALAKETAPAAQRRGHRRLAALPAPARRPGRRHARRARRRLRRGGRGGARRSRTGEFDAVYSQVVLYRLPDPARALREIVPRAGARRALSRHRARLAVGAAVPRGGRPRAMDRARARAGDPASGRSPIAEWRAAGRRGRARRRRRRARAGRRVRAPWLRRLGNAARPIYVAIRARDERSREEARPPAKVTRSKEPDDPARLARPLLSGVVFANNKAKRLAIRLTRWTGKSREYVHPKHLLGDNETSTGTSRTSPRTPRCSTWACGHGMHASEGGRAGAAAWPASTATASPSAWRAAPAASAGRQCRLPRRRSRAGAARAECGAFDTVICLDLLEHVVRARSPPRRDPPRAPPRGRAAPRRAQPGDVLEAPARARRALRLLGSRPQDRVHADRARARSSARNGFRIARMQHGGVRHAADRRDRRGGQPVARRSTGASRRRAAGWRAAIRRRARASSRSARSNEDPLRHRVLSSRSRPGGRRGASQLLAPRARPARARGGGRHPELRRAPPAKTWTASPCSAFPCWRAPAARARISPPCAIT